MYARKSNPILAGSDCVYKSGTHACELYARYSVTYELMENGLQNPSGYCGAHLPLGIRELWRTHGKAAIVQEIPGAWRHDKDYAPSKDAGRK